MLAGILLQVGGSIMLYTILGGIAIVQAGLGFMFADRGAWAVFGLCILIALIAWGLFYLLAVAGVSARSSNRLFPLRVFVTVSWLIFGVAFGIWSWLLATPEPLLAWVIASVGLFSVGICFTLSERESWTPRVERYIPRNLPGRFLAWLFFTGSAGGVLWCFLLASITLMVGYWMLPEMGHFGVSRSEVVQVMFGVLLFAWCYSMTGLLLRRLIVPKSAPPVGTAIALMLFALGCTLPIILAFMIRGPRWQFGSLPLAVELPHPAVLERTGSDQVLVYGFLILWASCAWVVNLGWFHRQWRAFRRYEPKPLLQPAPAAPNSAVAHVG
jgi:hypothetical protein